MALWDILIQFRVLGAPHESGKKLKKNKLGSLLRKIDSSLRTFWSESAFQNEDRDSV